MGDEVRWWASDHYLSPGVTAFWTARQLAQRENSTMPDTGWASEDTSRKGVRSCRSFSTL